MQRLRYIGMDRHARPVYRDEETGQKWKDTDPRSHVPASLYSTAFNTFGGEPERPIRGEYMLLPKRKTW